MRSPLKFIVLALAWALAGCGSGGSEPAQVVVPAAPPLPFSSLGELADAIETAVTSALAEERLDSDGDSIPDVVEARLGTNPMLPDSDRDGLVDAFELFGPDYTRSAPLPDANRDGRTAAADDDDDGDHVNDGLTVDTDGDGIANYFEFYGYTFDVLTGQFQLWDGDETKPHFFTDPLQPSTDQDAYPDGMEASGALLDPTVRHPGDDPLVPATPNIVFELVGYEVTLNESIQVTETESIQKGRTWSRQTETTNGQTNEVNWEVGVRAQAGVEVGTPPKVSYEGEVHANLGGKSEHSHSVATTVASGESVLDESGWSTARSFNPTDAARVKLFLSVVNRGTAPISNLVPTLTLKIGGLNVATFEPGGASIAMLVPGQVYPEGEGVHWVVGSLANGSPLSLTMSELRALERGAPVSLILTQARGDVMELAKGGHWTSIGDTNQYIARCDAVCARLRVELDDGTTFQQMVYADDTPSSPRMTLGEALRHVGIDDEGILTYFDANGTPHVRSVDGYAFAIDPGTLRANGWALAVDGAPATVPPADADLRAMRLLPTSTILVRSPRNPLGTPGPLIHYACLDSFTGEVQASVADYRGVTSVRVVDDTGALVVELKEQLSGAGFYSGVVPQGNGSDDSRDLFVVATNLDGVSTQRDLGRMFEEPKPVAPDMSTVTFDQAQGYLYAKVVSGNPNHPNSDILWVRAFHPDLPDGVADLEPVVNAFEDPDGFSAQVNLVLTRDGEPLRVVAFVGPLYTERVLEYESTDAPAGIFRNSSATLLASIDIDTRVLRPSITTFKCSLLDLDALKDGNVVKSSSARAGPFAHPTDTWVELTDEAIIKNKRARFGFNMSYTRMPAATDFSALTKADVEAVNPGLEAPLMVDESDGLQVNDVFAFVTTDGRFGKFKVTKITWYYSAQERKRSVDVVLRYVVWK